jgi:hypothetical protein
VRNSGLRAAKYHNETLGKHRIFQCPTLIQRKLNGTKQLLEISKFITNAFKDGIGVGSLYQSVGFDDNITVMLTPQDIQKYIHYGDAWTGAYKSDILGADKQLYVPYRTLLGDSTDYNTSRRWILVDKGSDMSYYPAKFLDRETLRSRASEAYYGTDYMGGKNPLALIDEDPYKMGDYREMHAAFCREYGILDGFSNR